MSAKRPRPAIPVLVHVDNPTDAASVTVDTSTIERKMDTVINNQERIYDKIPTSSGGGGGGSSADLTTVNEKTTQLAAAIGPASSTSTDDNIFGHVRNLNYAVGDATVTPSIDGIDLRSLLYNVREAIGYSSTSPTSMGTSIRNKLATIDTNTTTIKNMVGTSNNTTTETSLIGATRNLVSAIGSYGSSLNAKGTTVRSFLYNLCQAVGDSFNTPTGAENTVRGLLTAIKTNTASGDDLTTVNEKITAINTAVGDGAVLANDQSLIGLAKGIKASLGSMDASDIKSSSNIKGRLYNIQSSIGDALNSPSTTGTSVRDLLAAIKENTASGGGGGSADLTTVNEKTTALAAAIGSASDSSSTVSVIGLLKSITDKY